MPLLFTQAREVLAGQPIRAGDLASVAQAINSRRWSGIGDWNWRLAYYFHVGLFRKPRNDEGSLATPESEFWNFYQMLRPEDAEWPTTGPGEPQGANLGNHLNVFVLGSEALNLDSERIRIEAVPVNLATREDPADPLVAADIWELGKAQRGAFDPTTGDYGSPMFTLGVSYGYIRGSLTGTHGLSYGGYFPRPNNAGTCAPIDDGQGGDFYPPDLQIFFTNLATEEVVSYSGTCPEKPEDVAWVAYTPFAYFVFGNDGSVDYYSKAEWIEGPYTNNAELSKANANAISRAVAEYAAGFRGDETQRLRSDGGQASAFRTQEFLASQYALAPQIGWNTGDAIRPFYPRWQLTGADSLAVFPQELDCNFGGRDFNFPPGTLATHVLVMARGVAAQGTVVVRIRDNDELIQSVTLTANSAGDAAQIVRLAEARHFAAFGVEIDSEFSFSAAEGYVAVETTCLLEYKPQLYDLYATLRRSSYRGGIDLDGRGIDEDLARDIFIRYRDYGAIVPVSEIGPGMDSVLNQNAVFDAARELSKCVRLLNRHQFVGYAVQDGKSILYLRRWALGMSHNVPIDLLEGIAPAPEAPATDGLTRGRQYRVVTGAVQHEGEQFNAGQTFTARTAIYSGTGTLREADGIFSAYPGGFSNGWCVDFTFRPYYWSNSSIWKPDSYADILNVLGDRCTLDDTNIARDNNTLLHVGYGQRPLYTSETPSGYRYMPTPGTPFNPPYANGGATVPFMKSCRIYEPPVRVESAVIDDTWTASFGEQIVKVTMTGRVHHHSTAPSSISSSLASWNLTDLAAEVFDYRTTENALREYLLQQQSGRRAGNAGAGDAAFTSGLPTGGDVFGTVFPTLIFTKDIPEPYLDGNATLEPGTDSPALSEHLRLVELYLRAGCEGFVDGRESAAQACDNSNTTLYDYTFENLMFDADQNRHVPLLPVDVRPDNPQGHGPMPMTYLYAGTFNSLARAVNRLRTARLMLPMTLEHRVTTYVHTRDVTNLVRNATSARAIDDGWSKASGVDFSIWLRAASETALGTPTVGAWTPGAGGGVATSVDLSSTGSTATLTTTRQAIEFRWSPDGSFENAMPPDLAALVDLGNAGVIFQRQVLQTVGRYVRVAGETNGTTCNNTATGTVHVWSLGPGSGEAVLWDAEVTNEDPTCVLLTADASEDTPSGDVYISDSAGNTNPACVGGNTRSTNLTAVVGNTPAVTVPVQAYAAGD
jgi:hypothetical protein